MRDSVKERRAVSVRSKAGSVASRLLGLLFRIPSAHLCLPVCCVLSGTGQCDRLITRPEESYRVSLNLVRCDNNPLHQQ